MERDKRRLLGIGFDPHLADRIPKVPWAMVNGKPEILCPSGTTLHGEKPDYMAGWKPENK